MLSVFQVFKMVFGVIASVFVLYFLVTYAGVYGSGQQDIQRSLIMKNFRQLADDVYLTGNAQVFDFSKMGKEIYFDTKASPAVFRFGNNYMEITNPLFFRYGDIVSVSRGGLEFGWWSFNFVVATPDMVVVFNPLQNTEEIWDVMKSVVEALPDTSATSAKMMYAFCGYSGASDVSTPVGKFEFQRALGLSYETTSFYLCSAQLPANYVLVTVSAGCAPNPVSGICVKPDGSFYMAGSDRGYDYMDGLDIVAAIVGGTGSDIRGHAGENLYIYKQASFRESMKLAADVMAQRAQLLSGELSGIITSGRLEQDSEPAACVSLYIILANSLRAVSSELANPDYYSSKIALKDALSQASSAYGALASKGCEVPMA